MPTLNLELLESLKFKTRTAQELAIQFDLSINTVREFMDRMEATGVIIKKKAPKVKNQKGRPGVLYTLSSDFLRSTPYIRIYDNTDRYTITRINSLLRFYKQPTRGLKAVVNLPIHTAQLLSIGYRYNQSFLKDTQESSIPRLKKELRDLRIKINADYNALKTILAVYKQLTNDEWWDLENLATHFNIQLDPNGRPIPPIDPVEFLNIIESER